MISIPIADWIERETGLAPAPESARPVSGGCIHDSWIVDRTDGEGRLFVKMNRREDLDLFEAERAGLTLLEDSGAVRVPHAYASGAVEDRSCLVLEGLDLVPLRSGASAADLGRNLARLHETSPPDERFGCDRDNFIGATPQPNSWTDRWVDFFTEQRLAHQFALASERGRDFPDRDRLLETVREHLGSIEVSPGLLHGDLWGGNAAALADGTPVLFDPAAYFGDPETDLAFSRLFGGFPPDFYAAYRESRPEPEPVRETIYNLYHVLNHFVLFGGGYASQAEAMIGTILAELG